MENIIVTVPCCALGALGGNKVQIFVTWNWWNCVLLLQCTCTVFSFGFRDRPKFGFGFGAENNSLNCFGQFRFPPNIRARHSAKIRFRPKRLCGFGIVPKVHTAVTLYTEYPIVDSIVTESTESSMQIVHVIWQQSVGTSSRCIPPGGSINEPRCMTV